MAIIDISTIPSEVFAAAQLVSDYAKTQGWKNWKLNGIQERSDDSPLIEALQDALDESVDATTYPDGPNLPGELRRRISNLLALAGQDTPPPKDLK